MVPTTDKERILCVLREDAHDRALIETLETATGLDVVTVFDFESAIEQIANGDYTLLVTQFELPDMSAIDILAAVNSLRPKIASIVIDDSLNPQHAIRAFRLGAIDYMYRPVNLDFLLIRIGQELVRLSDKATPQAPQKPQEPAQKVTQLNRHISSRKRTAAFVLGHAHFVQIGKILTELQNGIEATFAGLLDTDHNVISAVGDLGGSDLMMLKQAFARDYRTRKLSAVLQEENFAHTFLTGENNSVFISDFGEEQRVSLVIITEADSKPGMVVHWAKRAAEDIGKIIQQAVAASATTTREHFTID